MNLRTRFLVGYTYLFLLLLVTAGSAVLGSQRLGEDIDRIVALNAMNVHRSMQMLEALERHDSAMLTHLLGVQGALEQVHLYEERFADLAALGLAETGSDEEAVILAGIAELFTRYQHERALAFERSVSVGEILSPEGELNALFRRLKGEVHQLLDLYHEQTIAIGQHTHASSRQQLMLLGFLVALALLSLGVLTRLMQEHFLGRLAEAAHVVGAIASGDRRRRIPAVKNDELGALSRLLNQALDNQIELEETVQGRLNQQRQLLLGVLPEISQHVALLGLDGEPVATHCSERFLERLEPVAAWIRSEGRAALHERPLLTTVEETFSMPGRPTLHVKLLIAPPARPVGWLVVSRARGRQETTASVQAAPLPTAQEAPAPLTGRGAATTPQPG